MFVRCGVTVAGRNGVELGLIVWAAVEGDMETSGGSSATLTHAAR